MEQERLSSIISAYPMLKILVLGDYFLDQYLMIDRDLSEVSVETDLESYQITEIRNYPGAAGTIANNLCALDIQVIALGVIGNDGRGYDLKKELRYHNVDTRFMIETDLIKTPTYTKPMRYGYAEPVHELERLDIKNRTPLPKELERAICANLSKAFTEVDGVIVSDQVHEENCGVMTVAVRTHLAELAKKNPHKPILVDSRTFLAMYKNVIKKCNQSEAIRITRQLTAEKAAEHLSHPDQCGAFVSLGENGMFACENGKTQHIAGVKVSGPIDICGAGDAANAGIISSLCSGATYAEAAEIGNIVASITIQQIGTTGIASRVAVLRRNAEKEG